MRRNRRASVASGGGAGRSHPALLLRIEVIKAQVPPGSRFKARDLRGARRGAACRGGARYRRRRWITHGWDPRYWLLATRRGRAFRTRNCEIVSCWRNTIKAKITVPRLVARLRGIGASISKRQVMRLLIAGAGWILTEALDVLRVGLETAAWISGGRHRRASPWQEQVLHSDRQRRLHLVRLCRPSKSRLNFLDLPPRRTHRLRHQSGGAGLYAWRALPWPGPVIN